MTGKSAAVTAACIVALVCGGLYGSLRYTASRAPVAAIDDRQADAAADGSESEAKAKAEAGLRDAAIAWGQVHLGVNAFISGTFSVSAGPDRFACGTLATRPLREVTLVIVAPNGTVRQVEGAEAKREFLERCNVVLL
jgi:hypothetical protein